VYLDREPQVRLLAHMQLVYEDMPQYGLLRPGEISQSTSLSIIKVTLGVTYPVACDSEWQRVAKYQSCPS